VLARDFRAPRLAPVLGWFNTVLAVGFAAAGIVLLVARRHAAGRVLGALALVDSGMFTFAGVMYRHQASKIRRAAATALQLNQTADDGAPH
jgi:apolipoprotein N-acyltransferase